MIRTGGKSSMVGIEKDRNTLTAQWLLIDPLPDLWTTLMGQDKVNNTGRLQKEGRAGDQESRTFCYVPGPLFILFMTISQNSAWSLTHAIFFFQINKLGEPIHYELFKGVPRALDRHCIPVWWINDWKKWKIQFPSCSLKRIKTSLKYA